MSNIQQGLVYPYGAPECSGLIKQSAQDFKVSEQLGFTPTGSGEHLFLYVQKTDLTTPQLVDQLAEQLAIAPRLIGYSGLKDKQAVTEQWISVHLPGCRQMPEIQSTPQWQILTSDWHDKKLRVGTHRSNRFDIVIRQLDGNCANLQQRIEQIAESGFANYFGEQRFGAQQDNVDQALKILNNRHKNKRLSRHKKSLFLSALRSELYNQMLSSRIAQGHWLQPLQGDALMLAGTQSVFSEALDDTIRQRYTELDLHSAVSLYGTGDSRLQDQALVIEEAVLDANTALRETLLQEKLKRACRANRAIAHHLSYVYVADKNEIQLQVELDRGVYLTSLLQHFVDSTAG